MSSLRRVVVLDHNFLLQVKYCTLQSCHGYRGSASRGFERGSFPSSHEDGIAMGKFLRSPMRQYCRGYW